MKYSILVDDASMVVMIVSTISCQLSFLPSKDFNPLKGETCEEMNEFQDRERERATTLGRLMYVTCFNYKGSLIIIVQGF